MNGLTKGCGVALMAGAALLVLMNTIVTPMLPVEEGEAVLRTSTVYLIRMIAALVIPLLFVFGAIGLYLAQMSKARVFGTVAFVILVSGNILVAGLEWSNLFVFRGAAQVAPEALSLLDESATINMGFAISIAMFSLGWILMMINVMIVAKLPRYAGALTLIGLFSVPLLAATPLGPVPGQIVGNVILGAGLGWLGFSIFRLQPSGD